MRRAADPWAPRRPPQSKEIMDLVALIGLGNSNKKAAGRLKNDLRRGLRKQFSSKTRDLLAHVEQRMAVRRTCRLSLCCCPLSPVTAVTGYLAAHFRSLSKG